MKINTELDGKVLKVGLEGRLDTITSPELEAELAKYMNLAEEIDFDLEKLEYISSAGLRVLTKTNKAMLSKGGVKISNVNDIVMKVFEVTGLTDILTIE